MNEFWHFEIWFHTPSTLAEPGAAETRRAHSARPAQGYEGLSATRNSVDLKSYLAIRLLSYLAIYLAIRLLGYYGVGHQKSFENNQNQ